MNKPYSRKGDNGYTSLLGKDQFPKDDERVEALGTVDELSSVLGLARSLCKTPEIAEILVKVQQQLYRLMTELAAGVNPPAKLQPADEKRVAWLEERIERLQEQVELPKEFIVPGDSPGGAALDMARTVTRRAERRVAKLLHRGLASNETLRYLNRLSSLLFILELREYRFVGVDGPTLVK